MAGVCAVDVGTTRIKAAILDEGLALTRVVSLPSVFSSPRPGWVEVGPEALWGQVAASVRQVAANVPVAALIITNQRATTLAADASGRALAPGLSWQDGRGAEDLASFVAAVGKDRFTGATGLVPSVIWSLAKILWFQRQDLPSGVRFATVQDWLLRRLGSDQWVLDHANASLTGLMDISSLDWDDDLLQAAGLDRSQLPALVASGQPVGRMSPEAAAATGLPAGTPLVLGGGDQQCADLGAGALAAGWAAANLGTAGVINVTVARVGVDPRERLVCLAHVVPGCWVLEGLENTYGGATAWGHEVLGGDPVSLADEAPVGSKGLVFLPYLAGSGAPDYDGSARGVVLGLALAHGKAELARAILEGISIELVRILEAARELTEVRELIVSGGGARQPLLVEMLAGLANLPVSVAAEAETTLLGAGLLGWVGLGLWPSISAAAAALPAPAARVLPEVEQARAYRSVYQRYLSALARLKRAGAISFAGEDSDERG